MSNADIAEMLAFAYAMHCSECEVNGSNPVTVEYFHAKYKNHIQDFRHLMHVDKNGRELNG